LPDSRFRYAVKPRHLSIPAVARTTEPAAIRRSRRVGSPILESDQPGKADRAGATISQLILGRHPLL
jgi:hypothetical protein